MSFASAAAERLKRLPPAGALTVAAIGLTLAAFWPAVAELYVLWSDSDRPYSHGLLVGPVSAWLVFRAASRAVPVSPAGSWIAFVLFLSAAIVWLTGLSADILAVQELLLPPLLVLAVAAAVGWPMARAVAFPVGFLFLAMPVWNFAVPVLQELTVDVVGFAVGLLGIPVFVEGNLVTIPEGVFEIADGCAGLHYFVVALTISSLFSYLSYSRRIVQIGFVAIAASLAILSNWIRVGALVLVGHYSQMQHYLITNEHYYFGWVLYAFMLVPTFLIARALFRVDRGGSPDDRAGGSEPERINRLIGVCLLGLLLAIQIPISGVLARGGPSAQFSIEFPDARGPWRRQDDAPADWQPEFAGADASATAVYGDGRVSVAVHMAVYRSQEQGRELISDSNRAYSVTSRELSAAAGPTAAGTVPGAVKSTVVRAADGSEQLIRSWYAVGGRTVASELEAKLWQVLAGLLGRDSGAVVLVMTACSHSCGSAGDTLESFLEDMGPALVERVVAYQGKT